MSSLGAVDFCDLGARDLQALGQHDDHGDHRHLHEDDLDQEPPPLTDMGNAERFAAQHSGRIVYLGDEKRWRFWDGRRWQADETGIHVQLAKATVRSIYEEAARETDLTLRKATAIWAQKSESANSITAMLKLGRSEQGIAARLADFDTDPDLLNLLNGTLNVTTLELLQHDPAHRITKLAPVEFDLGARSELWERVIETALPEPETRKFMQKGAGYNLVGKKTRDLVMVIHGATRTMKGTVQGALAATFGTDYVQTLSLGSLKRRDFDPNRNNPELASLRGARVANIYESGRNLRLDAELLKTISGRDPITAMKKYQNEITFMPQFALWIATNDRPKLPEDDNAVWERIREIPFRVQIPRAERDPSIREELRDPNRHGAAILAWAIEGLRLIHEEGFDPPKSVQNATSAYRMEMDPFCGFFSRCCLFDETKWTANEDLERAVEDWCEQVGEDPPSVKARAAVLKARGCETKKRADRRGWLGVGLLIENEDAS